MDRHTYCMLSRYSANIIDYCLGGRQSGDRSDTVAHRRRHWTQSESVASDRSLPDDRAAEPALTVRDASPVVSAGPRMHPSQAGSHYS